MNDDLISRQAALEIKVSDGYNVDGILYVPFKDVYKHLKTISSVHPEQKIAKIFLCCLKVHRRIMIITIARTVV